MKILIRDAKQAEAAQLSEIALAAKKYWHYPESWFELWKDTLKVTPTLIEQDHFWVAEYEGHPVGFVGISIANAVAKLEHMWVLPAFIHHGIGKLLFQHIMRYCRTNAIGQIRIEADPNATGFYEKMGAHQIGFIDSIPTPRKLPVLILDV